MTLNIIGLYIFICIIYSMIKAIVCHDDEKINYKLVDYILLPSILVVQILILYINLRNKNIH